MSLLSPPLEAFMAIVAEGTVHAAAKRCHVTQTAVTQRIRSLEARLSTTLFVRTRRGMDLTPAGEALYHYCQAVIELEGETLAKISGAGLTSSVQVVINGPSSLMHARVIPQCAGVMKQFPQLLMHYDIHDAGDAMQSLRLGKSQFVIVPEDAVSKEVQAKRLAPESYVLVASPHWQKQGLSVMLAQSRIIDFNPDDTMTFNYLKAHGLYDEANHERHFANRPESIAMMISEGLGYGVLNTEFAAPYVAAGKMTILNDDKVYYHQHYLVWYERTEPPAYFSAVIDAIR